jgi:DNA polymerase III delta prime subunit
MLKIPWIEKYRPVDLANISLNETISKKLKVFSSENLPHIILFGSPGIGKTTSALAIAKTILQSYEDFIELNASDNRGINMINDLVQNFCKNTINKKTKIIILDEADNITKKAQQQLINFMENYKNIKVIFTCNDIEQIIEPLQSRCLLIPFNRPTLHEIKSVLNYILSEETIVFEDNALDKIILVSEFDFRKSINNCEAIYHAHSKINDESVERFLGKSYIERILDILNSIIINKDVSSGIELYLILVKDGLNNLDFLTTIICIFQNSNDYNYFFEKYSQLLDHSINILEKTHLAYYKCVQTIESNTQLIGYLYSI